MENTVTLVFGMFAGCVVGMATTLSWQCFKAYKKETDSRFETAKKEILSLKERQNEHSERIGRTEDKIYDLETEFKDY